MIDKYSLAFRLVGIVLCARHFAAGVLLRCVAMPCTLPFSVSCVPWTVCLVVPTLTDPQAFCELYCAGEEIERAGGTKQLEFISS